MIDCERACRSREDKGEGDGGDKGEGNVAEISQSSEWTTVVCGFEKKESYVLSKIIYAYKSS